MLHSPKLPTSSEEGDLLSRSTKKAKRKINHLIFNHDMELDGISNASNCTAPPPVPNGLQPPPPSKFPLEIWLPLAKCKVSFQILLIFMKMMMNLMRTWWMTLVALSPSSPRKRNVNRDSHEKML